MGGHAGALRIFLSHTSELRQHPAGVSFVGAAEAAVRRAGAGTDDMISATADARPAMQWCIGEVERCDLYVGLIGFQYGTEVREEPGLSYTELEYRTATNARKPRLVFLLDEATGGVPASVFLSYDDRQKAFRHRLREDDIVVATFKTPEELELKLFQALVERTRWVPPAMAPDMPPSFVPRADLASQLIPLLTAESSSGVGMSTALRGAGGFGKTTMAAWLCHQPEVLDRFPDGVLWVELDQDLSMRDVIGRVSDICFRVSGDRPVFASARAAGDYLGSLLGNRRLLLVIDDVWNPRDLEPFRLGAPNCVRLITTRNAGVLRHDIPQVSVDAMTEQQTDALLRYMLPADEGADFGELKRRSGNWPLLLNLINAALRSEVLRTSLPEAIAWVAEGLRHEGPAALDVSDEAERREAVKATIEVGLHAFQRAHGNAELNRYLRLAPFAEDTPIPISVLERYWDSRYLFQINRSVKRLLDHSLIERVDSSGIRLHTAAHTYLRHRCADQLATMHARLLDAFRKDLIDGRQSWYSLPLSNVYLWANLATHLSHAHLGDELVRTTTDLRYVVTKTLLCGPGPVEADLQEAQRHNRADERLLALQTLLRGIGHQLTGFSRSADIAATLKSRLERIEGLLPCVAELQSMLEPPYLHLEWGLGELAKTIPLGAHAGAVHSIELDGLGTKVVSGGADGTVRIWDALSGRQLRTLEGNWGRVNAVRIDPGGARVFVGTDDGKVRVWEADTGLLLRTFEGHHGIVNTIGVDRSGTLVVSGGADGTVRIWDVDAGSQVRCLEDHRSHVNSVRINPSATHVVSGAADGMVRLWDAASGALVDAMPGHLTNPDDVRPVNSVAVDRSGTRVVSGGADGTVRFWELPSGGSHAERAHDKHVNSVSFDDSGTRVVSGGTDGLVRMWDAVGGVQLGVAEHFGSFVTAVAFDDSGTKVGCGLADGTVWVFAPVGTPSLLAGDDHGQMSKAVALDVNGARLVSGGSDGRVTMSDARTGAPLFDLPDHPGGVNSVEFDAAGERVVSAGADGKVRICDAQTGAEVKVFEAHDRWVNSVAFNDAGTRVVAGGADGTSRVWDATTGAELTVCGRGGDPVNAVAFDPTGSRLVSAGADRTVRIWSVASGDQLLCLTGHPTWVNSVTFDPTGTLVASGSYDGTVRIWDASDGAQLFVFDCRTWVACVRFDRSGRYVIAGCGDGAVRIWEVPAGTKIAEFRFDGSVFACCCGPEGQVAVGSGHGLHVLRLISDGSGVAETVLPNAL